MRAEIKQRIEQIKSGIIPTGYKETKIGIIPWTWECLQLKHFLTESRIAGTNGAKAKKITVKLWNNGVYAKQEIHEGSENTIYYKRKKGQFIYSKLDFMNCAFGIIPEELDGYETTLDLPSFDIHNINSYYLLMTVTSKNFYVRYGMLANGGRKAKRISQNDLLSFYIAFPPLDEQKKIVQILQTQDKMIELQQKKLDEYKRLKKAMLQRMFPKKGEIVPEVRFPGFTDAWEQRKLGDISDSYSGGTPTAGKSEYYGGDIPFIRSAEVNSDSTELFLTEEGLKNSSAKMVNKGDILYALYGATSGEVGLARLNGAINQAILDIKPHANYDAQFIMQWLRKSKENIISTYLQGGQGNLSGTIVTSLMVDCPTYSEQQKIGDYFCNLDNLITLHQRKLDEYKTYKKSLMQLLLTGIVRTK